MVVERAGGHEDRVGGRVIRRRRPYAAADLAIGHEAVGVDDLPLLSTGDGDLQELALNERVVAVAGDPDVGVVAHDEGAGPVVVRALRAVVPGEHLPQDVPGRGVEGVPAGVAAAHVEHPVHHRCGRRDAEVDRIAVGIRGGTEELLPDHSTGLDIDRVLMAVPGAHVGGRPHDARGCGDRPAGRGGELQRQRGRVGHAQPGVDRRRGARGVLQEHRPVLVRQGTRAPRAGGSREPAYVCRDKHESKAKTSLAHWTYPVELLHRQHVAAFSCGD